MPDNNQDDPAKEQRRSLKKVGDAIIKLKEAVPNLTIENFRKRKSGKDELTSITTSNTVTEKDLKNRLKAIKKELKKKLNKLKQLLNDDKYEDADNLIDGIRDNLEEGFVVANQKAANKTLWVAQEKAGDQDDLIKKMKTKFKEIEKIKDKELWSVSAGPVFRGALLAAGSGQWGAFIPAGPTGIVAPVSGEPAGETSVIFNPYDELAPTPNVWVRFTPAETAPAPGKEAAKMVTVPKKATPRKK